MNQHPTKGPWRHHLCLDCGLIAKADWSRQQHEHDTGHRRFDVISPRDTERIEAERAAARETPDAR